MVLHTTGKSSILFTPMGTLSLKARASWGNDPEDAGSSPVECIGSVAERMNAAVLKTVKPFLGLQRFESFRSRGGIVLEGFSKAAPKNRGLGPAPGLKGRDRNKICTEHNKKIKYCYKDGNHVSLRTT